MHLVPSHDLTCTETKGGDSAVELLVAVHTMTSLVHGELWFFRVALLAVWWVNVGFGMIGDYQL